jgi:hypothetical protein
MYLNLTKHKILNEFVLWQRKNKTSVAHLDYSLWYDLVKDKITVDEFGKATIFLDHEEYIIFHSDGTGKLDVEITHKGVSSGLNYYFKKINDDIVQKLLIDFGMLFCNVLVVIFAVVALNKSNDSEMKDVQGRLKLLQQQQVDIQIKQAHEEKQLQLFENKVGERKSGGD